MTTRSASLPLLLLLASAGACTTQVVCTSDQVSVDGRCLSLSSDPQNCGAVGRSCASGESCSAGLCCLGSQCPPAVYAACFNSSSVQGATSSAVPVGAPVAVESGPIALAWQGTKLWVANSMSNTLDRMSVSPSGLLPDGPFPTVTIPISGSFSDLEYLAEKDGLLYVSNAAVGSLLVVDPSAPVGQQVQAEVMLGAYSYPQGIAFSGGKAYVALNGSNAIAVVDLATRKLARTIDLSALAGTGAGAMPSRLVVSGGRVYVTLWNLSATTWEPIAGQHGLLAVLDAATDALVPGVNPVDLGSGCLDTAGLALQGSTLWVTCGFVPWDAESPSQITGSAFVPVNLSGAAPVVGAPVPVTHASPGTLVFCNGLGYAADDFSGDVLRFDPGSRSVTAQGVVCAPTSTGAAFLADVACGR